VSPKQNALAYYSYYLTKTLQPNAQQRKHSSLLNKQKQNNTAFYLYFSTKRKHCTFLINIENTLAYYLAMKTLQLIIAEGKLSSFLHNKEKQCILVFHNVKHSNLLWQKHLLITQNKNALLNKEKHSSILFSEVKYSDLLLKSVYDTKIL